MAQVHMLHAMQLNPLRPAYLWLRNIYMSRSGLQPRGTFWFSRSGVSYVDESRGLQVPNLAGQFHGVLVHYWERHGLGRRCLLVSANGATKAILAARYPGTAFSTADLY